MEQRGPHSVSERRKAALRYIRSSTAHAARWRERFARKVHPEPTSGCYLWSGATNQYGYGICTLWKGPLLAHRAAYALEHGADLAGVVLRHRCDNPTCVNPRHLVRGEQGENVLDMFQRGRARPYWQVPQEIVSAVLKAREEGLNQAEIARKLSLGWWLVYRILKREAA